MATRFELVLYGDDAVELRAAGEEAIAEIKRLERRLSFYRATSDLSRLNARAAEAPVRVDARLFELIALAKRLHVETDGTFDVALAALMRAWGFAGGKGRIPDAAALADARRTSGMHLVHLDAGDRTVRFERAGVALDLGAIGKGFALDEAALLLREAGVASALLHGGTSSIVALGAPPDAPAWSIALPSPDPPGPGAQDDDLLAVVPLAEAALGVSAVHGKSFEAAGEVYGHVLDPRTGRPTTGALLAAVRAASAAEADALSTALLVLGEGATRLAVHDRLHYLIVVPRSGDDGAGYTVLRQRLQPSHVRPSA